MPHHTAKISCHLGQEESCGHQQVAAETLVASKPLILALRVQSPQPQPSRRAIRFGEGAEGKAHRFGFTRVYNHPRSVPVAIKRIAQPVQVAGLHELTDLPVKLGPPTDLLPFRHSQAAEIEFVAGVTRHRHQPAGFQRRCAMHLVVEHGGDVRAQSSESV